MNQYTDPNARQAPENALSGPQGRLEGDCGHREAPEGESGAQADVQGFQSSAPVHNAGPSVRECAANDRRWWGGEKAGEQ